MATISFRLSSKVSDGKSELLIRFYEGTAAFRAKSRLYVPFDLWNDKAQRLILPPRVTRRLDEVNKYNAKIDDLHSHIAHQWDMDRFACNSEKWLQNTIDAFHSVAVTSAKSMTLVDAVCAYAHARAASPNTFKNLMTIVHHLNEYDKPISLSGVNVEYITQFAQYLYARVSPNTAKKILSSVRSVCNDAVDKELLAHSPFGGSHGYTIGTPIYGSPHYLTRDERDFLASFNGLPPKLAVQRDIFIFQCYCGCRVSDLLKLTPANIIDGVLEYVPQKTSNVSIRTVRVPLSPVALAIVDKYRHTRMVRGTTADNYHLLFAEYVTDKSYISPTLLPFVEPKTYNSYIHQIFAIAGLTRQVIDIDKHTGKPIMTTLDNIATSHLARKTFSQMVYSISKSERIAASFTGHSPNSRAFARYNEVDEMIQRSVISQI